MKYQEYIVQCDNCKNRIIAKVEVSEKESVFALIGKKVNGNCIQCNDNYHTIIEPYFEEEDLDD